MSASTRSVVKVLEAIATIMDSISPKAFSSYVISMTRNSSHVLEVGCRLASLLPRLLSTFWDFGVLGFWGFDPRPCAGAVPRLVGLPGPAGAEG